MSIDITSQNGSTQYENYLDRWYRKYVNDILENGSRSEDRTGTGTTKKFGVQARFDLKKGLPLLTTKAVWFEGVVRELLWFLRGQTNIWHLLQNDVSIWTDNAYSRYKDSAAHYYDGGRRAELSKEEFEEEIRQCPPPGEPSAHSPTFAEIWGELGPIYGKQWRRFGISDPERVMGREDPPRWVENKQVDQIDRLIDGLEGHPDSRRHVVTAWDPSVHGIEGKTESTKVGLSPCHYAFQCFSKEMSVQERHEWAQSQEMNVRSLKIPEKVSDDHDEWHWRLDEVGVPRRSLSLMWHQRSVDSFLGLPFNIASYAVLTYLLARQTGMAADELIFSGGDCHVYDNHRNQVEKQLRRVGRRSLPSLSLPEGRADDLGNYRAEEFSVEGYDPHPPIEAEMAV